MKKLAFIFLLLMLQTSVFASPTVFSDNGKFGLKDENGAIIVDANYKKLIRLGEKGWIIQKGTKFGVMDSNGNILVEPKYSNADRVLGKFVKLKKGDKYGLFDEQGFAILPVEYQSIDLLYGGMFLTCKNYKYGVTDFNGQPILDNIFDDIYMPKPNTMILVFNGEKYEIIRMKDEKLEMPFDMNTLEDESEFKITELLSKPVTTTGYYSVSATNYFLKVFSSISPAYEQTIDELMFSQGADAASIIMKFVWLPKFPVVYVKKYYENLKAPNNGPLSGVKTNLKKQMND